MNNIKRELMKLKTSFFIALLLITSAYAQTEISKEKLDSLYNKFLQVHNVTNVKLPTTEAAEEVSGKCSFGLNATVKYYFNQFTPQQQNVISKVNSRPDLETSLVSKLGKFRIHYDETGTNKPAYDQSLGAAANAQLVADAFDSAYTFEVTYLGFPEPPADNNMGGDNLFDVYLENLSGDYGGTYNETSLGNNKWTSYIIMDNDFWDTYSSGKYRYYTQGINAARATAAHEFHHTIQIGNYALKYDELYFHELTSTSMEEFVFNSVNDYYNYLSDFFYKPACSFSYFTYGNAIYGQGIWNIFLHEKYGDVAFSMIKRQWELFVSTTALEAINTSLSENQILFKQALNEFGVWCYLTGYRKAVDTEGHSFSEGNNYPLLTPNLSTSFSSPSGSYQILTKPLANNYIKILSDNGTYKDTIVAIVTNSDFSDGLSSPNNDYSFTLNLYDYEADGTQNIAGNYYGSITASDESYYLQSTILNNVPATGGESVITTSDFVFPNPFRYSTHEQVYIPVEYNVDMLGSFYIYSIDMNLKYSFAGKIKTIFDKFVLSWDGKDEKGNKLPTGVYIYISNSDGKIKKGKLVIYND